MVFSFCVSTPASVSDTTLVLEKNMKKSISAILFVICSMSLLKAEKSEVEKFVETKKSYVSLEKDEVQGRFGIYCADSAFKTSRDNITIYMFSRKGVIIGYQVDIINSFKLGNESVVEAAIAKAYSGYARVGMSSSDGNLEFTLINNDKLNTAEEDQAQELSKKFSP
jgi:hypothetical protein